MQTQFGYQIFVGVNNEIDGRGITACLQIFGRGFADPSNKTVAPGREALSVRIRSRSRRLGTPVVGNVWVRVIHFPKTKSTQTALRNLRLCCGRLEFLI